MLRGHERFVAGRGPGRGLLVAGLVGLALASGCIRRYELTPTELERLQEIDPDNLRVYINNKLKSDYPQEDPEAVDVKRRKIKVRGKQRPHERIVSRYTTGKIVAEETLNDMPLLWVTFYDDCKAKDCAYGFVLTELGRYSLAIVPTLTGYEDPLSYRRHRLKGCRLVPTKQRSLEEMNEVMAVVRRKGKVVRTIDLQLRTDTFRPTRRTRKRARGV